MIRDMSVKAGCLLMLLGFAAGIAGQIELLKPGISLLGPQIWAHFITLHSWVLPVSLVIICGSTISLIQNRGAAGQWFIWIGFSSLPLLLGLVLTVMLRSAGSPESYLADTVYVTANWHAFGTAMLLIALGGLSAWQMVKHRNIPLIVSRNIPLIVSVGFAFLIAVSGMTAALLQSSLGLNGMPKLYNDYPQEFAQLQFYTGIAAIACFSLATIYMLLLWRWSAKIVEKAEEVF